MTKMGNQHRQESTAGNPASTRSKCAHCDELLQSQTDAILLLAEQIEELRESVHKSIDEGRGGIDAPDDAPQSEQVDELLWQLRQREDEINQLRRDIESLEDQNRELASKLANQSVQKSVQSSSSCSSESLSWEERKQRILQQMESGDFDAESFVVEIQESRSQSELVDEESILDPCSFVNDLLSELERRGDDIRRKDEEIGELRCLLEQHGGAREGGVAIGAAAIAQFIDGDELVCEERERLKQLQAEWEEKFRQGEIEASLERAKLSRERQELAKLQAQFEEQLEHLKRESRQAQEIGDPPGKTSRRWLKKLGLADSDG